METEIPVASPCVKVCGMDDILGYCVGCYRTLTEIAEWPQYSNTQKLEVLARTQVRRAAAEARN
ncbi:MAG: hypothetical protein A3G24_07780 [Betaproteobacteria bacterium RIFCSPLOWO2_12_FULL_62_13]|nr:MAG: hypothetical protein A3G24_07780 [Betaproteobacteria bacterium RIFCSPLOWO2_12_FULL_62_13]